MKKSLLLKNTLIVLTIGFIVKLIGMIGKVLTTRILGLEGMSLYILSYPTLLLFINVSGFSLNTTISKLISEGIATKKYSPKKILYSGIKISLLISIICMLVYLLTINIISNYFLKNEDLFYPLLSGVILIPLVGISDACRGYYNGTKEMSKASTSLLLEQLSRTFFSLLGVYIGIKYSIIFANCFLIISLSLGEISSILYCIYHFKKDKLISYDETHYEKKAVFKMSSTLTISRLFGSFTFFLEPIIYTFVLSLKGFSTSDIHLTYTIIDAYTIPLLTFISFIPFSLSTAIIPHISESYAKKDYTGLSNYINKALSFTIYPALICLTIIYFYPSELMNLIFNTTKGSTYCKSFSFLFLGYYLETITYSILQAIGKVKFLFVNSICFNILRLFLIIILSLNSNIGPLSIIYSIVICINLSFIIMYYSLLKSTHFKLSKRNCFNLVLIFLFNLSFIMLLNIFNFNYLLIIFIIIILNIILFIKFYLSKI